MAISFPTTGLTPNVTTYTYTGHTWLWNGTTWDSVGTIQGTQGIQGAQGVQGLQGAQGIQGPTAVLLDVVPLDNLQYSFDGITSRFAPRNNGIFQSITNPFRLLLSLNGVIQNISFPEVVWGTPFSYDGVTVDSDGYIAFSEVPPKGSTFFARIQAGPVTQTTTNIYPFKAMDILLGGN